MTKYRIQWTKKSKPNDKKYTIWFNSEYHVERVADTILESGGYINKMEKKDD